MSEAMSYAYFDNNATTPLHDRVRMAMVEALGGPESDDVPHGNASSPHRPGQRARGAVESARQEVAALLGSDPTEIVFTASGTEANNAAVFEVARLAGFEGNLVLSSFEHPSVTLAVERCEALGMEARKIAPAPDGVVEPDLLLGAVDEDTRLVCLMLANNEIGTIQPVAEVGHGCVERGVPLLCDAVQAVGKIPVDAGELGADFLVLGGHKFHGPLGAAALRIGPRAPFESHLVGGTQERRRRASTVNVPAVVGLGEACRVAADELEARERHLLSLRERLEAGLTDIPDTVVHCADSPRLPNTANIACFGVDAVSLAIRLDLAGFAVSTGSACHSGVVEPSETLLAIGASPDEATASLRLSFGMQNEIEEVDRFLEVLERELDEMRTGSGAVS